MFMQNIVALIRRKLKKRMKRSCCSVGGGLFAVVALIVVICGFSSCSDDDSQEISLSPFVGMWELREVNETAVTDPLSVDRYMFASDPDKPSNSAGVGKYYYHEISDDQWQSCEIEWKILSSSGMLITGVRGGGSFEWMVSIRSGYTELRLYDPVTDTERVYFR